MKDSPLVVSVWLTLPMDAVVKIAFLIPDAADLFAFLEALRPLRILGPLEHLYQLGIAQNHLTLWPALKLDSSILWSSRCRSYEAIVKYYTNVIVDDFVDPKWLQKHLHPKTRVEWSTTSLQSLLGQLNNWGELPIAQLNTTSLLSMRDTLKMWTSLNITHLLITSVCEPLHNWGEVLPHLHHLRSLKVYSREAIDEITTFAASSRQLIELEVYNSCTQFPRSPLFNFTEWWRRHIYQVFDCPSSVGLLFGSKTLQREIVRSAFYYPSNEFFSLCGYYLTDVKCTRWTLSTKSLQLRSCSLNNNVLKTLTSGLIGSKITHLSICEYSDANLDGIEHILQVLPRTSIVYLELSDIYCNPDKWCKLTPYFENCPVEVLVLKIANFSPSFVLGLVGSLGKNMLTWHLDLSSSGFEYHDMKTLVERFTHPSRKLKEKQVRWKQPAGTVNNVDVQALQAIATEQGGEFIFESV